MCISALSTHVDEVNFVFTLSPSRWSGAHDLLVTIDTYSVAVVLQATGKAILQGRLFAASRCAAPRMRAQVAGCTSTPHPCD
eukprot:scaffold2264_cov43-Tisochrysis_lutea.AAC.4